MTHLRVQVADELMLTGVEYTLEQLSANCLKAVCEQLNVPTNGLKLDLVERLLCTVFNLVPFPTRLEASKTATVRRLSKYLKFLFFVFVVCF